jgi:hypothetical protein
MVKKYAEVVMTAVEKLTRKKLFLTNIFVLFSVLNYKVLKMQVVYLIPHK